MKNRSQTILLYLLPSLGAILWLSAFIGVLTKGGQMINSDGDLGRHITVGNYILDTRTIPLQDVFSHTMSGAPLTPHEWLSEVLFALSNRLMGLNGAILLSALVIATALWLVYVRSSQGRKTFFPLLLVGALTLLTSSIHWLARPHIFTFLLLALWVIVLEQMKKGKTRLWWLLPLLMLAWVNLHGAFIAGFATWLLYALGLVWDKLWFKSEESEPLPDKFWRRYLLGGVTALPATLVNPSGLGLWKTSVGYVANKFLVDRTVEYQAPDFHDQSFWPFLIFIILLVMVIGLRDKKTRAEWLIPSAAWLAMALYSGRNIPLFVIVSAPLLAEGLEDLVYRYSAQHKLLGRILRHDENLFAINSTINGILWPIVFVVIAVIGLRAGIKFDKEQLGNAYDPAEFPVEAVNWLEENPQQGEMFNYFTWGGYLLYREWPEMNVFIDGQTDFYGEELSREYLEVLALDPGWEDVLAKYSVDWVLLPVDELAARTLQQKADWTVVYKDDTAVIVHRK